MGPLMAMFRGHPITYVEAGYVWCENVNKQLMAFLGLAIRTTGLQSDNIVFILVQ